MGPWTYCSPLIGGILLALALSDTLLGDLAVAAGWTRYIQIGAIALAAGVVAQLLMIGLQGAFAQVLPVPFGKSIRGSSAVRAGYLILLTALAAVVAFLLAGESLITASRAVAILSTGFGISALLIYIWALPAATLDFASER